MRREEKRHWRTIFAVVVCSRCVLYSRLQDHLDLRAPRLVDYDSMKHEVLAYMLRLGKKLRLGQHQWMLTH